MGETVKHKAIDPVCGAHLDLNRNFRFVQYKGRQYCFCSPRCQDAFRSDPARYISKGVIARLLDCAVRGKFRARGRRETQSH